MLDRLRIRGFKSIADATLHLSDLSLLIGWNASGKSNVLEALELFCWAARTPRLSDLAWALERGQLRLRGNLADIAPFGAHRMSVGFCADIVAPAGRLPLPPGLPASIDAEHFGHLQLDLVLEQAARRGFCVAAESLRAPTFASEDGRLYAATAEADRGVSLLQVRYHAFGREAVRPPIACEDEQPVFTQLSTPARFHGEDTEAQAVIPAACRQVREALSAVSFLDPSPHAMRGYAFRDDDRLRGTGENLSAVLWHLVDQGFKEEILGFVRRLPERPLRDLRFLQTARNEVMVLGVESFGDQEREVPAALMSDGTLRVLAIAAALLSAEAGSLVVLEEIDNGVHASRAERLLHTIHETARARGLKVLLTTHNPALQDAVADDALADVTVAWRDDETGATRLTRLQDLPSYPSLRVRGPLGQLVTRGSLERLLRHPDTEPGARDLFARLLDAPEDADA
jgi:hypothetical protein